MYAILGATGKVGGAAVRDLRHRGLTVRAIVRDARKAAHLAQSGCEIVVADVQDADGLKDALAEASEVLVICPMNPRAEDAPAEHASMIGAIGTALEHVKPRSIVAISDYGAHHRTGTGVTLTFHLLEQRLRSIPVSCTFLRSAEHMQNWSRFFKDAAKTGVLPTFYRPNTKLLPIVSAPDVGIVAADLLTCPNQKREGVQIVHVEGPRRYSVDEVRETIGAAVGRPVEGRELPPERWVSALIQDGLSESYAQLVAGMYEAHNAGRIDFESGCSNVRRGSTSLTEAFASLAREHE
jgi:NAD(P)H dehydrogenase (quinone)